MEQSSVLIKKKERRHDIDVAKGLLILGLMVSHFSICIKWAGVPDSPHFLWLYIGQPLYIYFFMQCFLFVSGYCSNFNQKIGVFLKKQVRQLLIPIVFFSACHWVCSIFLNGWQVSWDNLCRLNFCDFWFLNALLISKILIYGLAKVVKHKEALLAITFIIMSCAVVMEQYKIGSNVYYYRHGLIATFFVYLGHYLKNEGLLYKYLTWASLGVYPLAMLYRFVTKATLPVQDANISVELIAIIPFILISLSGSLFFLKVCLWIKANRILEYFGRNSLILYCLHSIPFVPVLQLVYYKLGIVPDTLFGSVLFVLCTYAILIPIMVLSVQLLNTKYLKFFIGK